jgi:thioredoxin-dependent peroxiredoxin
MKGVPLSVPAVAALLFMFSIGTACAQDVVLEVGDLAPAFEARAADGSVWKSEDHVGGQLVVVYFYPAAMTGGCTNQACAFRDNRTKLTELGAEVVGISGDNVDGLAIFRRTNRINFPLLSDADGSIARAFGVPVFEGGILTREVDGEEITLERGVTIARWTFILDHEGRVVYKDSEVDASGDGDRVIAAIERLRAD